MDPVIIIVAFIVLIVYGLVIFLAAYKALEKSIAPKLSKTNFLLEQLLKAEGIEIPKPATKEDKINALIKERENLEVLVQEGKLSPRELDTERGKIDKQIVNIKLNT